MSSDEEERKLNKQIFTSPVEVQKARLERLMKNVEKPVFIPQKKEMKLPRAFQPHEFVRNVMGASAGAGSGEFDIYRGCRRRQIIREAFLSREAKEKEANEQWLAKVEGGKQKAESQTAKKRKKRLKQKGKLKNKKHTNGQISNKSGEKDSSSSSNSASEDEGEDKDEGEKVSNTEMKSAEVPVAQQEENHPVKESSSPLQKKEHDKTDIRKHIRNRQNSSSDEEKK